MKLICLLVISIFCAGCASIVKSKYEIVRFHGGSPKTTIESPFGPFKLNRQGALYLPRSRDDYPITVICNGIPHTKVLTTSPNIFFILGNLVFGGIPGWIVDGFGDKGYDYDQPINLTGYCSGNASEK